MTPFPLTAIVGHARLVEALLINAVAPDVGGVLVRGERGTAKSTAVRALAPLMPPVEAAVDEPFAFGAGDVAPRGLVPHAAPAEMRPAPLVELPIGATLDRLVGAIDLARALAGEASFEAGLLARAHQGILYVDEVNLLPDHLVDALLDAAASGVVRVEREAVSVAHDARFMLVGTMNVEEGELRPQLLDRFGLGVEVRASRDPNERAEIVRRRLAYERDAAAFAAAYREEEESLAARIAQARVRLPAVHLPERELMRITGACAKLGIDGVRGDIVTARAARALAALDRVDAVDAEHVRRAAELALAHRRRRDPLGGDQQSAREELERALDDDGPDGDGDGDGDRTPRPPERESRNGAPPRPAPAAPGGSEPSGSPTTAADEAQSQGEPATPDESAPPAPDVPARSRRDAPAAALVPGAALTLHGQGRGPAGRRAPTRGPSAGAVDTRAASGDASDDVAVVATLRARLMGDPDVRVHVRAGRESALICLVVDASGSMGARRRLAHVKGALISLLRDAYARRDRVALIAFSGARAEILVRPGAALDRAAAAIRELPTGGRTPLAAGLDDAALLLARERIRDPARRSIAIVLTDGRVSDPGGAVPAAAARLAQAADAVHVVDTEAGPVRLGLAAAIAGAASADLHVLETRTRRAA